MNVISPINDLEVFRGGGNPVRAHAGLVIKPRSLACIANTALIS